MHFSKWNFIDVSKTSSLVTFHPNLINYDGLFQLTEHLFGMKDFRNNYDCCELTAHEKTFDHPKLTHC